jgi:hypothetical protein
MTKTNYLSAAVALLATLLAATLLALGLPDVALPQEVVDNNKPPAGASDGQVGIQQVLEERVITSNGPLASIWIGNNLSCQVDHEGNGPGGEFYDGQPSALVTDCGTLLAVDGTTYGPNSRYVEFTPVSQSEVVGRGTEERPFKVTTVVDVGDTGLRITQTDSYVVGRNYYTTTITVKNLGTSRQDVVLYHYGDCYLNLTDGNTIGKRVESSLGRAPACESTDPNEEELSLLPRSGGYTYHAGYYQGIYDAPNIQEPYENTCEPCREVVDSGVGLSWEFSIGPGDSKTRTLRTRVVFD